MNKIFISFLICIILPQISFAYDPDTTHSGLTEQVVEFYNLNNHSKLSDSEKESIIRGAIDEDYPVIRVLNHFYDPVRDIGINNYQTAIDWVTGPNTTNDFNWPKSIAKYAEGDRTGALIGLGHILHLAEDMTVPDHTRNDAHIGDGSSGAFTGESLYENWAEEHKDRDALAGVAQTYFKQGLKVKDIGSITDYFSSLAFYSNNNYVSPDTLEDSVYLYPKVIKKMNGYAYSEDSYFYDEHKIFVSKKIENNKEINALIYIDAYNNLSVLEEYFDRLSKQAILSGAGIIELFFTEAENARTVYLEKERKKQEEITKYETEKNKKITEGNFLSNAWYKVSYAVTGTVSAIGNSISGAASHLSSVVYGGTSLVINSTKNISGLVGFTSSELATIGSQKVEQGIQTVKKVAVSTGQKVILYVKENKTNISSLMSPVIAYNIPIENDTTPIVNLDSENMPIVTTEEPGDSNEVIKKIRHHSGGSDDDIIDDSEEDSDDPIATTTNTYEKVSSPTILSAVDITNTTPTTTILFSGTSTTNFIITNDLASTSTSTDAEGNWSIAIEDFSQGTTTLSFYAEPDSEHLSTSTFVSSTNITSVINYTKSEPTEAMVFVENIEEDVLDISVPEPLQCESSLVEDICLITSTELEMSWSTNSNNLAYFTVIINDVVSTTTATSSVLTLEDYGENIIEVFAVNNLSEESEHISQTVEVYIHAVVINEVAWMGTNASANDEWIELYNSTPYDINLENWTLKTEDEDLNITLENQIEAEGFYLLERTSSTTISDVNENQIYTGALSNEGEKLTLYFGSTTIDQTPDIISGWAAGNNTNKGSMERKSADNDGFVSSNWMTNPDYHCTGLDANGAYIRGTPNSPNHATYPPELM